MRGYGQEGGAVRTGWDTDMLWTCFVLLLLAWMFCTLVLSVGGLAIHLLLVLAAVMLLVRLVGGGV